MIVRFLFGLLVGASLMGIQHGKAMDVSDDKTPIQKIITVPDEFPGHTSKPIQGIIKVPDHFDPKDYQQNKLKNEAACVFNSMLAGIMHTPYGQQKIQEMILSQDENNVFIGFHFLGENIFKCHENTYQYHLKVIQNAIKGTLESIENWKNPKDPSYPSFPAAGIKLQNHLGQLQKTLARLPSLWSQTLSLHKTTLSVPKKFVTKPQKSFPHDNPEWLNLIQQSYMKVTKNLLLRARYEQWGYTVDEETTEKDTFANLGICCLAKEEIADLPDDRGLNTLYPASHEPLRFFPLIDREIKKIYVITKENSGIDLSNTSDLKVDTNDDNTFRHTVIKYKNIVDFAHAHGLTKDLLTSSNVIQFGTAGHAVALFFGKDKVYYYDNVNYDHPLQREVYGTNGPIYEEAKYFKNQTLDLMSEEDFLCKVFQEIHFRCEQVAKLRGMGYASYPRTDIKFFKKPLVSLQ